MIKGDSSLLDQEMLKAKENKTTSDNVDSKEVKWTAQAMVRLERIPEFIRAVAKKGIEKYAVEQGYAQVDEKCLDYAKDHFNM